MTGENECRDSDFIVDVEVAPGVDPVINLEVGMAFTRVVTDDDVHMESGKSQPLVYRLSKDQLMYVLSQLMKAPPWDESGQTKGFKLIVSGDRYSLDYKSNEVANMLLVERRELEHSLNWLSTLGGAFSALGENDLNWAVKAGKVSRGQLLIAVRLGSPQIMARCRLYASISLLQLGNLKAAREILLREYAYAKSLPSDSDPRLKRMCIGIWAKLQYEWKKRRVKNRSLSRKKAPEVKETMA